jgi:hypothetical protein
VIQGEINAYVRSLKETLINWLYERITLLCGTRAFAYPVDMPQLLRSGHLVLHLVSLSNQAMTGRL